jgi:hypothetical protein
LILGIDRTFGLDGAEAIGERRGRLFKEGRLARNQSDEEDDGFGRNDLSHCFSSAVPRTDR